MGSTQGTADGAEVDRVRRGRDGQVGVADGHAEGIDGAAPDDELRPFEREAEAGAAGLHDADACRQHIRADAVAGDARESVGDVRRPSAGPGWRGDDVGHASTSRTTASRSLLSAET